MKRNVVVVSAVLVSLTAAGCTDPNQPEADGVPASSASAAASSMTFDEAYQKVPLDGVGDLKITWEVPAGQDADEVLAARRALAYRYWMSQAADWTPISPIARYLFTERSYQVFMAGMENATTDNPSSGPVWFKLMGTEKIDSEQSRVTFCADLGWWGRASDSKTTVRKERDYLESYVMKKTQTGDGEHHWLADQRLQPDTDREAQYGKQCAEWAQHKP